MKKFIIKSVLFLLPLVVSAYFIDRFLSYQLTTSNVHAQKEYPTWNDVMGGKVNSDIVINGSSRAWVQYDPMMMQDSLHASVYNLGIDGHNFWLQYMRYQLLLKHNKKPKLMVQSVDITFFEKRTDLYNMDQFLPYMLWDQIIQDYTGSYNGYNYFDYKIPLIRYYGKFEAIKTAVKLKLGIQNNPIQRVRGYEAQIKKWNNDLLMAKIKMNYYEVKADLRSMELFDRFLAECKKDNIQVILVYPPEYIDGQKFVRNRKMVIDLFEGFSKKYEAPFYDFSSDSLSFNQDYFYNSTHMNKVGAELFTQRVIQIIKEEWKKD